MYMYVCLFVTCNQKLQRQPVAYRVDGGILFFSALEMFFSGVAGGLVLLFG